MYPFNQSLLPKMTIWEYWHILSFFFLFQIVNKFLEGHRNMQILTPCNISFHNLFLATMYVLCHITILITFQNTLSILRSRNFYGLLPQSKILSHTLTYWRPVFHLWSAYILYHLRIFPTGPVIGRIKKKKKVPLGFHSLSPDTCKYEKISLPW